MERLRSLNPATGEVVGEVPITPVADIPGVVARARAAQPAWQGLGLQGRADLLEKTQSIFQERAQQHCELITSEMGNPMREGLFEAGSLASGLARELDEIVETLKPDVVEDGRAKSTIFHDRSASSARSPRGTSRSSSGCG